MTKAPVSTNHKYFFESIIFEMPFLWSFQEHPADISLSVLSKYSGREVISSFSQMLFVSRYNVVFNCFSVVVFHNSPKKKTERHKNSGFEKLDFSLTN